MGGIVFRESAKTYIDNLTLSSNEIKAIKKSWESVKSKKCAEKIGGDAFIGFLLSPETFEFFNFSRHQKWKQSKEFNQHCKIVVNILASVVSLLDKPDIMEKRLEELGLKHSFFDIKPQHYTNLGIELILAFEAALGSQFTDEAKSGWSTLYEICSRNIQVASKKFIADNGLQNFVDKHVTNSKVIEYIPTSNQSPDIPLQCPV